MGKKRKDRRSGSPLNVTNESRVDRQTNNNINTVESMVVYENAAFEEPYNSSITVKFTPTQVDQLRTLAQSQQKDMSTFIRDCVSYYIGQMKQFTRR